MDYTLQNQTNICSSYSSVEQDMYPTAYSLFFVVSFPANCLSLYVALMLMKKGNNVAVYLFSLSISDLLYTISLPVWIELSLQKPVGDVLYSTINLIMYNSFYVGSGLLCCISVDRYLAVVYPLHFHWVREVKTAAAVSTAVWILEIITHVILLDHMGALQTTKYLFEQRLPMTQEDANVALIRIVLGFLLPALIMAFCFQQIMGSLQRSTSIVSKERRKVGLLLFFLFLTYIVSFLPYQTVMLLRATLEPGSCTWTRILRNSYLVTVAITTLNCTLDPIIYCLISESAKKEIKIVMKKSGEIFIGTKCPKVSTGIHSVS